MTKTKSTSQRYLEFWNDELNSAMLYEGLAEMESNPQLSEVYRRLAGTERAHAGAWAGRLKAAGTTVPPFKLAWRTRTLLWLARRMGPAAVLPAMTMMEATGSHGYQQMGGVTEMAAQEQSRSRLLRMISGGRGGMEGPAIAQLEGRHRSAGGNALRAAVLGANDGLVSNLSLVMGVAGAELSSTAIFLTGMAGLLAGAISMALGEWISVQSSPRSV